MERTHLEDIGTGVILGKAFTCSLKKFQVGIK